MTSPVVLGDARIASPSPSVGRKAITLHRLLLAGLPVPPAIALSPIQAQDAYALREAAGNLGYPLAVRSSANVEDMHDAAAPGLFESILDVSGDDALLRAARDVVASGQTPLVRDYLQARGISLPAKVAIVLQRQITPTVAQGVLYTRPPGQPESSVAILEIPGETPLWIDREGGGMHVSAGFSLTPSQASELWALAEQTEQALSGDAGLDIEWIWGKEGLYILQARPIVHRHDLEDQNNSEVRSLLAFSRGDKERLWQLDATHNPLPLSPAQAGLVHEVAPLAPYDMRVVGGYLYTAKRRDAERKDRQAMSQQCLQRLFHDELLPKMEGALAKVESQESPRLGDALDAYKRVFSCYTEELAPALAAAGEQQGGNPLSAWIARAVAGQLDKNELLKQVAPIAPAWDVSVPTYGETPERVERALAIRLGTADANSAMEESLRESDDMLFYRAQDVVRRALLTLARRWGVGDHIFFMPLREILKVETSEAAPKTLVRAAGESRDTIAKQRRLEMPLSFTGGEPLPTRLPPNVEIWRGLGTGGYVTGRVVRVARLRDFPVIGPDDQTVLVIPTVTPAHALAARGAVAVVCEYGEHLGHGAAMARELAIPCIVGCKRAWRELETGDQVGVHGDAGLVARLVRS
ncbi:MAG: hypothetical protein GY811_12775 [Myxococcales bacterium]|nr:hypothetical protein [Myxococcales bacterium]